MSCIYNYYIVSNLKDYDSYVNKCWSEYFIYSSDRIKFVENILKREGYISNTQRNLIENNLKRRDNFRTECSLNFVKLEYDVDIILFDFLQTTKEIKKDNRQLLDTFSLSNAKLNQLAEKYNDSVLFYNKYVSTFPNFLIAKWSGFKKKKYFSIKYGIQNEDPIFKSKQIPKWAVGVDTTL